MGTRVTKVRMGKGSDVGLARDHQEDDHGWLEPTDDPLKAQRKGNLYLVADGMGGHAAGEVASSLAVEIIPFEYYADPSTDVEESLRAAIKKANTRIREKAEEAGKEGMGTTVVCAVVRGDELYIAHVGDSRVYLLRDREMQQLTRDHSWVLEQVERGLLAEEEVADHPYRNIITRALGNKPDVEVDTQRLTLMERDILLLCTDGLSGVVEDEQIRTLILTNEDDPQAAVDYLIEMANTEGGPDNISAIVLRVDKVIPTPQKFIPERYKVPKPAPIERVVSIPRLRLGWLRTVIGLVGSAVIGVAVGLLIGNLLFPYMSIRNEYIALIATRYAQDHNLDWARLRLRLLDYPRERFMGGRSDEELAALVESVANEYGSAKWSQQQQKNALYMHKLVSALRGTPTPTPKPTPNSTP